MSWRRGDTWGKPESVVPFFHVVVDRNIVEKEGVAVENGGVVVEKGVSLAPSYFDGSRAIAAHLYTLFVFKGH